MAANGQTVLVIAYDGTHNSRLAVRYAGKFLKADRAVVVTIAHGPDIALAHVLRHGGRPVLVVPPER
jgi:hypothetical protein